MKKPAFLLATLFFAFVFLVFPPKVLAQYSHKFGPNVHTVWNVESIRDLIDQGLTGSITLMASPEDADRIQAILDYNNQKGGPVQIAIRDNINYKPSSARAQAWIDVFNQLQTSTKIIFIPHNEPFLAGGAIEWRGGATTKGGIAQEVAAYNYALWQAGQNLWGGKVLLATPMINQFDPEYARHVQLLNQAYQALAKQSGAPASYLGMFQVMTMNFYARYLQGQLTDNPRENALGYRQVLQDVWGLSPETAKKFLVWAAEFSAMEGYPAAVPYPIDLIEKFLQDYGLNPSAAQNWLEDPYLLGVTLLVGGSYLDPNLLSDLLAFALGLSGKSGHPLTVDELLEKLEIILQLDLTSTPTPSPTPPTGEPGEPKPRPPGLGIPPPNLYPAGTGLGPTRPNACEPWQETEDYLFDCASNMTARDEVEYCQYDVDCFGNSTPLVYRQWGGILEIVTKPREKAFIVPLAGKVKDPLDIPLKDDAELLADYFEGPFLYDFVPKKVLEPYERVMRAGVIRKLTPWDQQNELKKEMIRRARGETVKKECKPPKNKVHDYLIVDPDLGGSLNLSSFAPPPEPEDFTDPKQYRAALESWSESASGRLWGRVPLVSRKDTPGKIYLSVKNATLSQTEFEVSFPHLARLYEITRETQDLLMPEACEPGSLYQVQENNFGGALLAASNPLLAQAPDDPPPQEPGLAVETFQNPIYNPETGKYKVEYSVKVTVHCAGRCSGVHMNVTDSAGNLIIANNWTWDGQSQWFGSPGSEAWYKTGQLPAVELAPGESFDIRFNIKGGELGAGYNFKQAGVHLVVDEEGNSTTPEDPEPIAEPTCGYSQSSDMPECLYHTEEYLAGRGDFCCRVGNKPIKTTITAEERFINPHFNKPPDPNHCPQVDPNTGQEKPPYTKPVEREVRVDFEIPLLESSWQQTTENMVDVGPQFASSTEIGRFTPHPGLFNLFKPYSRGHFRDLEAQSPIHYLYTPYIVRGGRLIAPKGEPISAEPEDHQPFLLYPHLGGIWEAKECISKEILMPISLAEEDICPEKEEPTSRFNL